MDDRLPQGPTQGVLTQQWGSPEPLYEQARGQFPDLHAGTPKGGSPVAGGGSNVSITGALGCYSFDSRCWSFTTRPGRRG